MQNSKYMLATERDLKWGLTVSTVGYEEIAPGDPYPTKGHADGYYFNIEKGRVLNEYQLLYNPEGEGVFESAHCPQTKIKAGDMFLLFPGEWHTYHPNPRVGWKSHWIGFKGRNMDEASSPPRNPSTMWAIPPSSRVSTAAPLPLPARRLPTPSRRWRAS